MADDEMTLDERRKYLKRMWSRYAQADRKSRNALLTEMEQVTGMHRKSLTRLMLSAHQGSLERKKRKTQRCATYGKEVGQVVRWYGWCGKAWTTYVPNASLPNSSRQLATWPGSESLRR